MNYEKKNQHRIDFDDPRLVAAIEEFDMINFLQENEVDFAESGPNIGINFIGIYECPSCLKQDFHAGIHRDKKFLTCWVCGAFLHPVQVVAYYLGVSCNKAAQYIINSVNINLTVEMQVQRILFGKEEQVSTTGKNIYKDTMISSRRITSKDLQRNKKLKEFFKKRDLHLWHCNRYDLRIGKKKDDKLKIIFPVYIENNILVSYQWRRYDRKQYHLARHANKYLYNSWEITEDKILLYVEGILDYIALDSFLRMYKLKDKFIATTGFSKNMSEEQSAIINKKRPKKVISLLDNDAWFDFSKLRKKIIVDVDMCILPKDEDPSSMSLKQMKKFFFQEVYPCS